MQLQLALWLLMITNLLLLEGYIRFSGGSGSLMSGSAYAGSSLMRIVFAIHIIPAIATYVLWSALVVVTYRRRKVAALGGFSSRHRLLGKLVIGGLIWTALSACGIYYLTFRA